MNRSALYRILLAFVDLQCRLVLTKSHFSIPDHEQEISWRRISKRNEERRLILLEQQEQAQKVEDERKSKEL